MQTNCRRLTPGRTALVVVDMQERLFPAMGEKERLLRNVLTLIRGAAVLAVPVFATEQYRQGLGATLSEIAQAVPKFSPLQKLAFSACAESGLLQPLHDANVSDVVLCGIEAHVCVTQSCLDLLDAAFGVFVAADATSSRTAENRNYGLERMRDAGAAIASTEMVLFELLRKAGTDEFKQILRLVK